MRATGRVLLATLALVLCLAPEAASAGQARDYAYLHVRGRLLDRLGGDPMKGVRIRLTNADSVFEATTDAGGAFVFEKLPIAGYDLTMTTADGDVLERIEEVDIELPTIKRFEVRFGRGEGRSATIQAQRDGVSISAPPPPVSWPRFWKQGLIFAGAAILLAL